MSEELNKNTLDKQLREHAAREITPAWEGQSRMLMKWAADAICAANEMIEEQKNKSGGKIIL